ncbi:uncharacterized protein LOC128242904 [Mya arenaria]|uniref:uncharacterized protein LOC128242904 n=1 Tax=Mya arenaria TaxID=6604 RepID=UPI0022E835E6|nr:uncharacterized protein LOC128242904 [Mya arenaria]XP_052816289.1 uncharacterized protein LOC128242904 [Mya arenaria]XP_052816290.1 uncharacterized protein LOC128242904 [Mya arenaria]
MSNKRQSIAQTPRTAIGEYLDVSRTHSQKVIRNRHEGLIRTPEPLPRPRHARVSSLRGERRRTSLSTSVDVEDTPRHLIEGFLQEEHSTAPLVRVQRRTSQTGVSTSQPPRLDVGSPRVGSRPGARRSIRRSGSGWQEGANMSMGFDNDTPRTLLQNFMRNTSSSMETPQLLRRDASQERSSGLSSPDIQPLVNDTYHTPSPFRESSEGSMISRSSRRGRTPHRTGKFNITAQEQNSSLVIPATNPNDYTVPSPFRSTSDSEDEEVIPDSQAIHSQTACSRRRGSFNLTVPESMLEHLRLQRSQQADRQSRGNRSDHHSGISLADQHSDQLDQYDGHQGGEEGFDRSRQEMFEEGNQYDDQMAYRNDNDDVDDDDERTEYTSRLENRESDHYVRQEMYDRDDGLEQYQDEEMDDDQSEPSGQYREKSGHDESESLREHRGDGLKILPEGGMYMLSMKVSESSMEEDYRNMSHVSASSRSDMSNIGMAEVENGTYVGRDESASRSCRSLSNMEMADAESGMYVDRDDGGNRSRRSLSNMEMTDAESRMYVGRDESASRSHRSVSNMEMTDAETGMYLNKDESTSRSYRSLSRSRDDLAASRSDISRRRQSSFSAVSPEVDTMTRHLSISVDLERSMKARDQERMGRYSEGHKSRFGSPSRSEKDLRLSDGHLHGKGSPFDMQRLNSSYEHQNQENQSRSASRSVGNRSSRDLNISSRSRHSSGESFSSSRNPHTSSRSFDGGPQTSSRDRFHAENMGHATLTDDMYQSPRSLLSGRRSPSIASTPRVQEDWESCSERGDGNSPLKAVTPSPVVSPRGASPASSSHRSQRSARMSRVSDGSRSGSVSGGSMMSSRSQQSQQSPRIRSQGGRTPLRSLTLPQSESQTRSGTLQSQRSTPVLLRSSPRLQGSPSASLRSTSRSMQRSSPRTPGSNKGTPKSEKSVLGSSTRRMGLSQASPVIAGKRQGSAEVDALPHQTMLFSPPIASTQNIGALSRLSPQPSTSRQSRITDFVQQAEGENTNITSTAAEITVKSPKKKVVRKPRQKSRYLIPTTTVRKHFNHFAGMRVAKDAIEEVMKVSETYWDNLCADLEAYARHAGRKRIQMADFELLFKRQGYVTEKTSLNSLIRRYLPWEEADKLIPVIGADNKIYPKL